MLYIMMNIVRTSYLEEMYVVEKTKKERYDVL